MAFGYPSDPPLAPPQGCGWTVSRTDLPRVMLRSVSVVRVTDDTRKLMDHLNQTTDANLPATIAQAFAEW